MSARFEFPGFSVGHWSDDQRATGCTVILCPSGASAGGFVAGGAPGTRETDLLEPGSLVQEVQAVLLTGGSAWGLGAANGVMRWLAERGVGFAAGTLRVPIVPTAVLFDLYSGDPQAFPAPEHAYAACDAAQPFWESGRLGAATGALVGKALGLQAAQPGSIGVAQYRFEDGTFVAALVVVNAWGHIVDPSSGAILAGPRDEHGAFVDSVAVLLGPSANPYAPASSFHSTNTTIGVVVTNAPLQPAQCSRIARTAHTGLAQTIRPVHTLVDGDTLFVLSHAANHQSSIDPFRLGVAASSVVAQAVVQAFASSRS